MRGHLVPRAIGRPVALLPSGGDLDAELEQLTMDLASKQHARSQLQRP
jgi:hypothetical protein